VIVIVQTKLKSRREGKNARGEIKNKQGVRSGGVTNILKTGRHRIRVRNDGRKKVIGCSPQIVKNQRDRNLI